MLHPPVFSFFLFIFFIFKTRRPILLERNNGWGFLRFYLDGRKNHENADQSLCTNEPAELHVIYD